MKQRSLRTVFSPRPSERDGGFTLVEVLVAMFIFSVVALMSWQGLDALLRSRDIAQSQTEASIQRGNALGQWEADLSQLQATGMLPTLLFDGNALRLTRLTPDGMQVVLWTVQGGRWWRWASEPTTRALPLYQAWQQSQQWVNIAPQALAMLDEIGGWQIYYRQRGDAGWSNAQSTGDVLQEPAADNATTQAPPPETQASAAAAAGQSAGGASAPTGSGPAPGVPSGAVTPLRNRQALPQGIRLSLNLPAGELLRDIRLPPSP